MAHPKPGKAVPNMGHHFDTNLKCSNTNIERQPCGRSWEAHQVDPKSCVGMAWMAHRFDPKTQRCTNRVRMPNWDEILPKGVDYGRCQTTWQNHLRRRGTCKYVLQPRPREAT